MLDTVEAVWKNADLRDSLHLERFIIARTDKGGEGGTVTFENSDKNSKSTVPRRFWRPEKR